ncbi:hypothetical protein SDC9_111055 [bioreactor metagenome]|uniref:Uncharacterized protein n=1 Tax=bioreactor metagenome TaxID=1076179 RepID=A0A645BFD6_9ZZZZ
MYFLYGFCRDIFGFWLVIFCFHSFCLLKLFVQLVHKSGINALYRFIADQWINVLVNQARIGIIGGNTPLFLPV